MATAVAAAEANTDELIDDLSPVIKVYKSGRVERLFGSPHVPPCLEKDPATGVSSKDITISPQVSARLHLPKLDSQNQKLPILVYFHGGGFCLESAFSEAHMRYLNVLSSEATALVVSVEYRLAPEHPLPAAYEDSWAALQWVASHGGNDTDTDAAPTKKEPWLITHGDFSKLFIGGDSAGGNISHYLALRAGTEKLASGCKILGVVMAHPYFWGSKPSESISTESNQQRLESRIWLLAYPSAPGGIDNPLINPLVENAPNPAGLACSKLFVCTAEKDTLREMTLKYVDSVKKSGWKGEVELVDVEGEDHCFQAFHPYTEKAKDLIRRMASFIKQQ